MMVLVDRRLLCKNFSGYGGCYSYTYFCPDREHFVATSVMEEEERRSGKEEEEGEVGTSGSIRSGRQEGDDEGWLQLGVSQGTSATATGAASSSRGEGVSLELSLFSGSEATGGAVRPFFPMYQSGSLTDSPWPDLRWGVRSAAGGQSSQIPPSPRPVMHLPRSIGLTSGGDTQLPIDDIRVVNPPSRPQIGMWLMLKPAPSQEKEPFLPEIPKCYLRIKNMRMTVLVLMKYLVKKLGLHSELEVEIACRGQLLPPSMCLLNVRDNIWRSTDAAIISSEAAARNQVMTLLYGRKSQRLPFQLVQ